MRVLAIGDVHGCLMPLNDLLAAVKPTPDDLLITLGDVVDRGPDSKGVLDRMIRLRASGVNLVCLRGNHEIMMVEARKGGSSELRMWQSVGGLQTLGSYGTAPGRAGTLKDVPADQKELVKGLLDAVAPTLKAGELDLAGSLVGPDAKGRYQVIGA
ncbi:MAG: serine/threonine protein phosphatase, partial [Gemmataceae bacterium]|nr:serine/threonine protein phosphatase [Gemmataceae bacterium]